MRGCKASAFDMKRCSKCRKGKSEEEFFVSRKTRSKDGLHNVCKDCSREYTRNRRWKNVSYEELLGEQAGACAICGLAETTGRRLAIDHDHKTGRIRGLLCSNCNRGIGHLKDDTRLLSKAIEYLSPRS